MGDAWVIGPLIIQQKWAIYMITIIMTYIILRIAVKIKAVELSILDLLWNAFFLFLVVYKLSYSLFHPMAVVKNPLSQLYFTGGGKGAILGLLAAFAYFYYKSRRDTLSFRQLIEFAVAAVVSAVGINQGLAALFAWPYSNVLFYQSAFALILLFCWFFNLKKLMPYILLIGLIGWGIYDFSSESAKTPIENEMETNGSSTKEEQGVAVGLNKGNLAPNFTLQTLQGETVTLSDFRGNNAILNFWASWCPPCRAEMPDMQRYYDKNKDENFTILAVNMTATESSQKGVNQFIEKLGVTFPVVLDINNEATDTYQIMAYPTSYFVDKNGLIQYKVIGAMNEDMMKRQGN
ncbi:TlpA disulfide reductase family protein [Pueribacillus theae]|nr:TlpA disulfide reductase family protein [Pueribacillus theae]